MRVTLICTDKPGHLEVRKANREAHLSYIAATGVVEMAGPFLDDAGGMCGSLVMLDVPDLQAAQAWAAADPYAKAGLFESVVIREWKKVIG
ncbi:MAG: YciI family protein [Paracoccaceae bacterium]